MPWVVHLATLDHEYDIVLVFTSKQSAQLMQPFTQLNHIYSLEDDQAHSAQSHQQAKQQPSIRLIQLK